MKIVVTWNKPDGTRPTVEVPVNPDDPNRNDEEVRIGKAIGAAEVYFREKFGLSPMLHELCAQLITQS